MTGVQSVLFRSLDLGLPVLAPSGPETEGLPPAVVLDDWEGGLAQIRSGELEFQAARLGRGPAAADTAMAWDQILSEVSSGASRRRARRRTVRLLVFLDLIQDAELCLPILREALTRPDVEPHVTITGWFARNAPAAVDTIRSLGLKPEMVKREQVIAGAEPAVENHDALLTPVATNLRAHRHAQGVVEQARRAGVPTFSMQHGLENVGLTFFDKVHTEDVQITSDYLFVWFPPDYGPPSPLSLRRKFIHVGAVKSAWVNGPPAPLPEHAGAVISVFENLHWHRYDPEFRQRFVADLAETARAAPHDLFVLKPHPAGMWTKGQVFEDLPPNTLVIDPVDPAWASVSAQAVIARSDRVITTPSTVALDAAMARRPVAVVGYRLDLPLYAPLPILRSRADWSAFTGPRGHVLASDGVLNDFLHRHLIRDEAAPMLLDALVDRVRTVR